MSDLTKSQHGDPLERAQIIAQRCLKHSPVVILGSGASVDSFGIPGMAKISNVLLSKTTKLLQLAPKEDLAKFQQLLSEEKNKDFEKALDDFEKTGDHSKTIPHIANVIWQKIAKADWQAMLTIAKGEMDETPLARLLNILAQRASGSVDVVTTNYDRIAESAAERARLKHYTGFTYGHFRRPDEDARREYPDKAVRVWKVHGSLDWFILPSESRPGEVVAFPTRDQLPKKEQWVPAIVLPGKSKYELTHREPFRTILRGADDAIARAKSVLCIGFGFRDMHILPELRKQCEKRDMTIVILTKHLTDDGKKFLKHCRCDSGLVLTQDGNSQNTCMVSGKKLGSQRPDIIEKRDLWRLSSFMQLIESKESEEKYYD